MNFKLFSNNKSIKSTCVNTSLCSRYTIVNRNTKRGIIINNCKDKECIIKTLCNCTTSTDSSSDFSYSYSKDNNPFIFDSNVTSPTQTFYEIIIGPTSNTTSFPGTCLPTTKLTVNCKGLFGGVFPENQISTTTFDSSAVNGVKLFTGINTTTGTPNPIPFIFYQAATSTSPGYDEGICKITVEADGTSTTINLINKGLIGVNWIWNPDYNNWYSVFELETKTEDTQKNEWGEYAKIQVKLQFTLNNDTDSSKNQTWMQMDATLYYKGGTCSTSNNCTVSGKMNSIDNYTG